MFRVNIRALCKAVSRFEQTENTVLDTQIGLAERLTSSLNLNDTQRDRVMDLLYRISLKSEDEFEHTPKTIVAGVIAHVMECSSKSHMKPVSEASGVSVLSIHKIASKLKTLQ